MKLSELQTGEKGVIVKVKGHGAFRKRIIEMGFVRGEAISVIKNAPLKDPVEYKLMGYDISLRRSEAALVEVVSELEAKDLKFDNYQGVIDEDILKISAREKGKIINVALVGNPNSGKTTLFNYASGSNEHVGNYSGVTVEAKKAKFKQGDYTFNIVDLPGTYSLTAYSPEELYVRRYILNETPDIVINIVDASNLERNLYLTTQLIDMDIKVIVALNMFDEMQDNGDWFNYKTFGAMLGIPIVPTVGSKGKGVSDLFDKVIEVFDDKDKTVRHIHINYGLEVENAIRFLQSQIKLNKSIIDKASPRFLAIKLLEGDTNAFFMLSRCNNYLDIKETAKKEVKRIEERFGETCETLLIDAKYGFIAGALKETYKHGIVVKRRKTDLIDNFLTHKYLGFPIFLFFIFIMFFATFEVGQYPEMLIEQLVGLVSKYMNILLPAGALKDMIVDGIIGGVGGVIVFLPNILILFLFISFMEDSGYMARAAFIMDRIMHKIGLHGKSFIPLIMGFGCNVPAIMATRTLENRNDRLLTMLINPFMSCSARLPVYVLIIGAFFPSNAGVMLFLIYGVGILLSIIMAKLFKKVLFKSKEAPFVMELPPYRIPTLKTTIRHMWNKSGQYLKKMGGIILLASIIIWGLGYYPVNIEYSKDYNSLKQNINVDYFIKTSKVNDLDYHKMISERDSLIKYLDLEQLSEHQQKSYIGQIGAFIEPVIRPLGFDWKMGVSLLSGVAAKEIVVSTMGVMYQTDKNADNQLRNRLLNDVYFSGHKKGEKVFNPAVALAFLMFVLIYFPCIAVIIAIKKESGSWKWALFTIFYTTTIAWVVSFLVYQIGSRLL